MFVFKTRFLLCAAMVLAAAPQARAACGDLDPGPLLPVPEPCPGYTLDGITYVADTLGELTALIGDPPASTYWQHGCVVAAFQNYVYDEGGSPDQATASAFNFGNAANAQAMYDDPEHGAFGFDIIDWPGTGPAKQAVLTDVGWIFFRQRCLYCIMISPAPGGDTTGLRCMAEAMLARIGEVVGDEAASWGELKRHW
ncbi:hypothetical protein KKG45_11535 [bacterium]|nr:hypothetical protein [bacterium]MBU1073867.1 hypothetical protein [bacterium]MBU1676609.1 hypothetical protein [bacterium]